MNVLLDTCVIIDFLRRKPMAVDYIASLGPAPAVSVVTLAELRAGQRHAAEIKLIDDMIGTGVLLPVDRDTAEQAGAYLRAFAKSHALDTADALIAATAVQHGLPLATLNLKHFPMFPHLAAPY